MEKLYEVALNLYQKITTTNEWTFEDYTLFNNIYHVLATAGYAHIIKLKDIIMADSEYNKVVKPKMIEKREDTDKLFRQFYLDIGTRVLDIFEPYFDEDKIVLTDYSDTISFDKAKKMINKYYHKVDPKNDSDIKNTLLSDRIFLRSISKYVTVHDEGCAVTLDDEQYVSVVKRHDDDLIDIHAVIALVHELGHSIGLKNSTTGVDDCYSPFREVIAKTHEFAFCKCHSKESDEYKIHFLPELFILNSTTTDLYDNSKNIYTSEPYTLGIYVGLYLSHLYMNDRNKFKYLYNEIKKYIFTSEESKIFDLLLQEKEIKTGEFLKREIEETQKILIKK